MNDLDYKSIRVKSSEREICCKFAQVGRERLQKLFIPLGQETFFFNFFNDFSS